MGEKFYKIELRQFEVGPTNARHYFWVLKDETGRVIGEMHGHPADWKTGERLRASTTRDRLKFFDYPGARDYSKSAKLPYVIAFNGPAEDALERWQQGLRRGEVLNRAKVKYHFLKQNSNSVAQWIGRGLGFRATPIIDPRPVNPNAGPTAPALMVDLLNKGVVYTPMSPYEDRLEEVGGYGLKPGDEPPEPKWPDWPTKEWP
jgi:hypothetical protein